MMLSAGVPMLVGGDEALRSINCNNNPYNLDSSANWLSYTRTTDQSNFQAFTKAMIAFRKAHPALRPANFYSSVDNNGNVMEQLRWFKPDGGMADAAYFNDAADHAIAWRIDGTEFGDTASAIYVAHNAWSAQVNFTLPWPGANKSWHRVTDTCTEVAVGGENTGYGLCGRGTLLLIAK